MRSEEPQEQWQPVHSKGSSETHQKGLSRWRRSSIARRGRESLWIRPWAEQAEGITASYLVGVGFVKPLFKILFSLLLTRKEM